MKNSRISEICHDCITFWLAFLLVCGLKARKKEPPGRACFLGCVASGFLGFWTMAGLFGWAAVDYYFRGYYLGSLLLVLSAMISASLPVKYAAEAMVIEYGE